jgi:hypothetical protein
VEDEAFWRDGNRFAAGRAPFADPARVELALVSAKAGLQLINFVAQRRIDVRQFM